MNDALRKTGRGKIGEDADIRPSAACAGKDCNRCDADGAIAALYEKHGRILAGALRKRFGDGPPDPDDIAQLAFQKMIERRDLPEIRNREAFLWRTARNLVLKEKRAADIRSKRDYEIEQIFFPSQGDVFDPERVVSAKEQISALNEVLLAMPEKRRRAFMSHRVDGLTVSDVAKRLRLSRTAVNKHLARAFAQIDAALEQLNGG